MKKSILATLAAAALALPLAACTTDSDQPASTTSTAGSASASGQTLVVYSNSVSDGRGDWLTEQAKEAGFTIQYVDLGGADVMNRLLAEKANPIADVVFGLNQVYFEKLKAAGVLDKYTPKWADLVDSATYGDPEETYYWPIVREPIMLVYDTAVWDAQTAPHDWPDLWTDPAYAEKYEVPAALGGATTQMVLSGILSRYQDPGGELGISAEGWEAVNQFFANGNRAIEGQDLYARMAAGEVSMGQMWLAGKATREKEYGVTSEAVHPEIGVPMVAQSTAVIAGTTKQQAAQEFLDWFGSAEVQAAWSQEFFTAPVNTDALDQADQDAVAQTDSFTAQDIDWTFVSQNLDGWVEKVELNYVGQ